MEDGVEFVGLLGHDQLARHLPAAGVGVVPSIFPETFGLVAAELAASGVPFVAYHSGLREADGIVGRDLPFEVRVGFEENLACILAEYEVLPENERRCGEVVRPNRVQYLSWGPQAQRLVRLVEVKG